MGHSQPNQNDRAFTLIELLIVVSVISIIMGLLLPALAASRNTARRVLCASNLHTAMTGVADYAFDNHGGIPDMGYEWSREDIERAKAP